MCLFRAAALGPQTVVARTTSSVGCRTFLRPGLVGVALLALLVGCGTPNQQASQGVPPERVFSAGLTDVQEIYIKNVNLGELALTGVNSLNTYEPGMTVERKGSHVEIALPGQQVVSYPSPADDDAEAWGTLTGTLIRSLRGQSAALGDTDAERIYETIFDAMVKKLDPFSRYASRDEALENRATRDGFGGIGVRIEAIDEGVKVLSVMDDTPASSSGLQSGDLIVRIDGQPAQKLDQRDVIQRLRGPIGSQVRLDVLRDDMMLQIDVMRSHIVPQTVIGSVEQGIAVVTLSSFNHSTAETLRDKILKLQADNGGKLDGLILDLRGNPGGLLDQSVAVADLFITSGRVVTTHGRHPDSHQYFSADGYAIAQGVPMVVLINGSSASASEIVAAALQDTGRALVIGSVSYGKGTVQTVLGLPNDAELTLTWARFHAPSGYPLHARGVLPDICTSGALSADAVLRRVQRGQQPFPAALRQMAIDSDDAEAVKAFRNNCPPSDKENDLDLKVAKRLLLDRKLYARATSMETARLAH